MRKLFSGKRVLGVPPHRYQAKRTSYPQTINTSKMHKNFVLGVV
ncbi:Protein of unknown function [Bacillus mycoides]|nr:Protein of unknown function [Bacillus mycoides]